MIHTVESNLCPEAYFEKRENVTYGEVQYVTYDSKTTGLTRGANILLPPNYTTEKAYPVIYFQHGIMMDEYGLINDEKNGLREIAGNLISEGKAREAIIVFGNMYATSDPEQKPGFDPVSILPYDNFINELIHDLKPYVDSHYSTLEGRENNAVLGFSLGGRESLYIGMKRSDLFAYAGAISPAPGLVPGKDWAMEHPGMMKEEEVGVTQPGYPLEVLMITCGDSDKVVGAFPKSYHEIMEKNGVEHLWYEVPMADHDHHAISSGFYNFLLQF